MTLSNNLGQATDLGSADSPARQLDQKNASFYLIAFFFPWIFDYQAADNNTTNTIVQSSIIIVSICVFLNFISIYKKISLSKEVSNIIYLLSVWLLGAIFSGLLHDSEVVEIIKASVSPVMFIIGVIFTYKILSIEQDYYIFRRNMLFIMTCVVVERAGYAILTSNADIIGIRYYILSSVIEIFSAYIVAGYFKRLAGRDIIGGIIHFGVVFISLTRTVLLTATVMFALPYISRLSLLFNKVVLGRLVLVSLIVIAVASLGTGSTVLEAWTSRFTSEGTANIGIDPTAATRLAEIDFQVNSLLESTENLLMGLGIAAVTSLTGDWAILVAIYQGAGVIDLHDRGFGHCQYTGYVFTGGILFGSFALIATIKTLIVAFKVARGCIGLSLDSELGFLGLWGSLGVVGTSVYGLLAGVFANRGFSLFYGVTVGMMFWAYGRLDERARRPAVVDPEHGSVG